MITKPTLPPEEKRSKRVPVPHNEEELARLDRLRGDLPRAVFLRKLVRDADPTL